MAIRGLYTSLHRLSSQFSPKFSNSKWGAMIYAPEGSFQQVGCKFGIAGSNVPLQSQPTHNNPTTTFKLLPLPRPCNTRLALLFCCGLTSRKIACFSCQINIKDSCRTLHAAHPDELTLISEARGPLGQAALCRSAPCMCDVPSAMGENCWLKLSHAFFLGT